MNKEIKDLIDNLQVWDDFSYKWWDYIVTEADWEIFEFASTTTKEKYIWLNYDELFDYLK